MSFKCPECSRNAASIGSEIVSEMLESVLGMKRRSSPEILELGATCSVTFSELRAYDGWDIRISIGPPGTFDEKDGEGE